jgi:hypothetical protein
METREQMKERLRAQEAWGRWNTAPLANKVYGKSSALVDVIVFLAGLSLLAFKVYFICKGFTS